MAAPAHNTEYLSGHPEPLVAYLYNPQTNVAGWHAPLAVEIRESRRSVALVCQILQYNQKAYCRMSFVIRISKIWLITAFFDSSVLHYIRQRSLKANAFTRNYAPVSNGV